MRKIKKILVPLDGSKNSLRGLDEMREFILPDNVRQQLQACM